ncbi:membrane hypothetical protein [Candidatus Sulfobium mesophilum]|uniref:Uncharacterized protein n=1 Tax=Candidatus Sulfobium mesophilum TaxID=2016548 RepID=A0A2U3QFA3_9BACT|nr:membrane hypothetical protein [Candidatus Sulfobium mesophilum]
MKRLRDLSTRDLFPGGFFYLAIFILFVSFGFILLSQTIWDYDFWWHIATGKYIVETGSIPTTDPFSFTSQLPENNNLYPLRERFIMTQYWLAQILFYLLYNNFGPAGIGVVRAVLLLGTVYAIYKALKDRGASPYIIYLSVFLSFVSLLRSLGERPVLFTICFSIICFVMIDDFMRRRSRSFYFLPLLMLVWSNLHGGFILGDGVILVFMVIEGMKLLFGKSGFAEREKIIFFLVLFLALGASGINPNGFFGFMIALSKEYAPFYVGINEYQSPFLLYKMKVSSLDYGYLTALFLFPVILILRNRKFNPTHLVILILLAAASVSAGRFTVYYGIIASLILGDELNLWLKEHREKFVLKQAHLDIAFSIIMLGSSVLYFVGMTNLKSLKIRESAWTVPTGAANFIINNHIKGNMLNDMGIGGYLTWRLYPEVRTFIDTRSLNYTVMKEYTWMATATESIYNTKLPPGKTPLWNRLLEHYRINLIVFNPLDIYGNVLPLTMKLLDDDNWVLVFSDINTFIMLKNVPENEQIIKKFRKTNDELYNSIIVKASFYAQSNKGNPLVMEALGDIFEKMGKTDDAIKAYKYALKRMPESPGIKEKLDKLMEEKPEVRK